MELFKYSSVLKTVMQKLNLRSMQIGYNGGDTESQRPSKHCGLAQDKGVLE